MGVSTSMSCDFESASFPLTVDRPGVSPLGSVRTRLTTSGRGILLGKIRKRVFTLEQPTDLSMADLVEDGVLAFSVPFAAWVRDVDVVNLSDEGGTGSVTFFLSLDGAETGVEGRGEGAAVFCCNSSQQRLILLPNPTFLTLVSIFAGAHRCSRFLRLA